MGCVIGSRKVSVFESCGLERVPEDDDDVVFKRRNVEPAYVPHEWSLLYRF